MLAEDQNNSRIREIRIKQYTVHQIQKNHFQRIFKELGRPNFTEKQYYELVVKGIPTEFRNYLWPQLIPNHHKLQPQFYYALVQQMANFQMILQSQSNNKLMNVSHPANNGRLLNGSNVIGHSHLIGLEQLLVMNPEINTGNKIYCWMKNIQQDIPRTFPELKFFHQDVEQYQQLANVLGCFALFRSDIGYVQGMSSIVFLLLQQLRTQYRAFTALTTLITTTCLLQFFTFQTQSIDCVCANVEVKLQQLDVELYQMLKTFQIQTKMLVVGWVMTLFTRSFQFDSILELWDIIFLNHTSHQILEDICVAIIRVKKRAIFGCDQGYEITKILKNIKLLPEQEEQIFNVLRMRPSN